MTIALVMGGASCVYADIDAALKLFKPDVYVAVKDIWIEYPNVDHVATYHVERIPRELEQRRALGYPDPQCVWTYPEIQAPRQLHLPLQRLKLRGGSSGLLGVHVGLKHADKVVIAGIPLDPKMPHYHRRKHGKPWSEALLYQQHWKSQDADFFMRVRSMSGWTRTLLGEPVSAWLKGEDSAVTGRDLGREV